MEALRAGLMDALRASVVNLTLAGGRLTLTGSRR